MPAKIVTKPSSYAWLVFALSACFLFYKYILQVSPAVMTHELMQTYALTGTSLGFLVGFYFYTYMIMQIPAGILLDKFGTRRLTSAAIFLCALGILIFSQTSSFAVACFARLVIGFGAAFATISYMKVTTTWFPYRYFPLLSGLFGTACMLGAGTAGAPLAWLITVVHWRGTLVICAVIGFALTFLFWFFIKDHNPHSEVPEHHAADEKFSWKELQKLLYQKSNWALILYGGLAFTPAAVFGGLWGVPYLMGTFHLPKIVAASSASLVFFAFAIGCFCAGWIGRFSNKQLPIVITGTTLSLICISIIIYSTSLPLWLLNTCIFLFGFGSGGFVLSYAIARNINSLAIVGTVIGFINMGDPLFGGIAEPLIGKILDSHWDGTEIDHVRIFSTHAYQLGLSVLVAYLICALACCFFIKENKTPPA